jgi:hypothetical protein
VDGFCDGHDRDDDDRDTDGSDTGDGETDDTTSGGAVAAATTAAAWTMPSSSDDVIGCGRDAWGSISKFVDLEDKDRMREGDDRIVLTVDVQPPLAIRVWHLRAMGLVKSRNSVVPNSCGCGVLVRTRADGGDIGDGGADVSANTGWCVPSDQERGSIYIEDVRALLSVPWPHADTIAAFSASVYGPSGELWDAVAVVGPDNEVMEGPHARAQIRGMYPYIHNMPFRPPRRLAHKILRTAPRLLVPIVEPGASISHAWSVWSHMMQLAASNGHERADGRAHGCASEIVEESARGEIIEGSGTVLALADTAALAHVEIAYHERGVVTDPGDRSDLGAIHRSYVYVMSDGGRVTIPALGWGAHGATRLSPHALGGNADDSWHSAQVRSLVREYWAKVPVETLDEFLEAPVTAHGRMTPHDAPKRLVRPRVFVMVAHDRARRVSVHEIALDRVHALAAWDRSAHIVDERDECFVYLLTNTVDSRFPLVVVAGLCIDPFLPSSVHELISRDWRTRGETCPHLARSATDHHDDDRFAINAYMRAAEELPADADELVAWLARSMN